MSEVLSELNFQDDFDRALTASDAARWKLEKPRSLEVLATMSSAKMLGERFQARLLWRVYPGEAPSLKIRDPVTGNLDCPKAWPVVRGFRPTSLDACVNWCTEGLNLHPEWKTDPRFQWDPRGNVLLKVLRILQDELDQHFEKRYA